MSLDLPLIWGGIIAFGVFMYVLLDGFDLGIGILFPLAPGEAERDTMMNSVAPVWDGNETWLVLGGATLFGAFPLAFAIILPALYLPLMVMLIALIFRGVAFEFRFKADRNKHLWSLSFYLGSLIATFAQGVVLGTYVQGIPVAERAYAGGTFDWFSPFALVVGLALVFGYALLGSTWLILKTEGALQAWAYRKTLWLLGAVLLFMGIVSLWVPFLDTRIEERWFKLPNFLYLSPVPLLVLLAAAALLRAVRKRHEWTPFILAIVLFALGCLGLGISLWPNIVPPSISLWQAAAAPESQGFLLIGVAILIPIILGYTAHTYWVFRGKVRSDAGYH
ncbi:MAG: cytochrome d ubiquinol oxidase subunit II [Kiloniellales bacterium]